MRVKMKIAGVLRSATVVKDENSLPHTARFWGAGSYLDHCAALWRCEGKFYTTKGALAACHAGSVYPATVVGY